MSAPNAEGFRLAILGGCAASQRGVPLSRLYHRIVSARWKEAYGVRMNVILDRYDQSLDYASRVERCLRQSVPDAVLIHVRPSPFLFRCKPIVRYVDASGRKKWSLHPMLFALGDRPWNADWEEATVIGTGAASEERLEALYPPFRKSLLRSPHAFLGRIFGLAAWARREEIRAVRRAARVCSAAGIPLFILGPTPYLRSKTENRMCSDLSDALRKESAMGAMHFIAPIRDHTADAGEFLMPDLWHLSQAGHAEMAEAIFRALTCLSSAARSLREPDPRPSRRHPCPSSGSGASRSRPRSR